MSVINTIPADFHAKLLTLDPKEQEKKPSASVKSAPSPSRHKEDQVYALLMEGKYAEAGYPDHSEADLRLCGLLAKKCSGDAAIVDAAFRISGLMRPKWDEKRGEKTYGEMTIDKVLSGLREGRETTTLVVDRLDGVIEEVITWFWEGRIPSGRVTLFAGDPGLGKSVAVINLLSLTTRGKEFPDGAPPPPEGKRSAVLMSSEDGYGDVVKPRAHAAGVDLTKIYVVRGVEVSLKATKAEREFALSEDTHALEKFLDQHPDVGLVVVDPLTSYFGKRKLKDGQDVKAVMDPLKKVAEKYDIAIVLIHHFNKTKDLEAVYKSSDSVQIIGSTRAAWGFFPSNEDAEIIEMLSLKQNLAKTKGLKFRVNRADHPLNPKDKVGVPVVEWLGASKESANSILEAQADKESTKIVKVMRYLEKQLAGGEWKDSQPINKWARDNSISPTTMSRATNPYDGGLEIEKRNFSGTWKWRLKSSDEPSQQLEMEDSTPL